MRTYLSFGCARCLHRCLHRCQFRHTAVRQPLQQQYCQRINDLLIKYKIFGTNPKINQYIIICLKDYGLYIDLIYIQISIQNIVSSNVFIINRSIYVLTALYLETAVHKVTAFLLGEQCSLVRGPSFQYLFSYLSAHSSLYQCTFLPMPISLSRTMSSHNTIARKIHIILHTFNLSKDEEN